MNIALKTDHVFILDNIPFAKNLVLMKKFLQIHVKTLIVNCKRLKYNSTVVSLFDAEFRKWGWDQRLHVYCLKLPVFEKVNQT